MRGVRISHLIDYPEYIPQLAQWLFEQWGSVLGEKTLEVRIKKLKAHMNRDELPIAWVAHANGQLLGTAALRVHDLHGREDLTPWLGGVFVSPDSRRQGIGAALCATVEDAARSRGIQTLYLFTLDKQAWYSRQDWTVLEPCVWHERQGDIMCKQLTKRLERFRKSCSHRPAAGSLGCCFSRWENGPQGRGYSGLERGLGDQRSFFFRKNPSAAPGFFLQSSQTA